MKTNLFIPKKLNIGFQNRKDTFDGKLSYIIYYDEKGKLRKETSWQNWRDKSIPNLEVDNIPIEGLILNKNVGGYKSGWDYRQSYIRVYDPRGFEFEITIENLMYILESSDCIDKTLQGTFVYSWYGSDLVLLPTKSSDYQEILNFNNSLTKPEKITNTTLVEGYTYTTKKNNDLIYLGKFMSYCVWNNMSEGEKYFFADLSHPTPGHKFSIIKFSSVNGKMIKSDKKVSPFLNDCLADLSRSREFSPLDESKYQKIYFNENNLSNILKGRVFRFSEKTVFSEYNGNKIEIVAIYQNVTTGNLSIDYFDESLHSSRYGRNQVLENSISVSDFISKYKPYYHERFLKNGMAYDTSLKQKYW